MTPRRRLDELREMRRDVMQRRDAAAAHAAHLDDEIAHLDAEIDELLVDDELCAAVGWERWARRRLAASHHFTAHGADVRCIVCDERPGSDVPCEAREAELLATRPSETDEDRSLDWGDAS